MTVPNQSLWRHQMETFSALLAICAGNSPHEGQWRGALMFSVICVWINDWVNNREAGDLTRYRAHYDVIVLDGEASSNAYNKLDYISSNMDAQSANIQPHQSGRSPKVVALFLLQNIIRNIIWLLQLYDTIQMKSNYT